MRCLFFVLKRVLINTILGYKGDIMQKRSITIILITALVTSVMHHPNDMFITNGSTAAPVRYHSSSGALMLSGNRKSDFFYKIR